MKPNWPEIVKGLMSAGWTLTALAPVVGLSISALSDIKQKRTKQPSWQAGVKLMELHEATSRRPARKRRAA